MKMVNIFALAMIALASLHAQAVENVLTSQQKMRLSWREVSSNTPGMYELSIEVKICAGENSKPGEVKCVSLGQIKPQTVVITESQKKAEPKINTPFFSAQEVNDAVQKITVGMQQPLVRIGVELHSPSNSQLSVANYTSFPSQSELVAATDAIKTPVVISGAGLRTRVLVEFHK